MLLIPKSTHNFENKLPG